MKTLALVITLVISAASAFGQQPAPVLDMQLHALRADEQGPPPLAMCTPIFPMPAWDPADGPYGATFMGMMKDPPCDDPVWSPMTDEEVLTRTLEVMERRNVYGVLSGHYADTQAMWMEAAPERFIPGLHFGISPNTPSVETLREMYELGEFEVLGEVVTQYAGIAPDDERMAPYWALAEELDIPVGIHVGPGPPGVIYLGLPNYRARLHSPLTMEEVLVRHPRLRVYLMHGGYPFLDDLLAMMYAHPQLYIDIGVIVFTQPRPAFYRFLQGIVDAGFGNRVMFGSDQMVWPETIERSIEVIEEAPFLTEEQKRDILYNNAARFLHLSDEEIARHHGE